MTLKISKPSVRTVGIRVLSMRWDGPLGPTSPAAGLKCSACRERLGGRRFATAWINDAGAERSMRLCESCGVNAEEGAESILSSL